LIVINSTRRGAERGWAMSDAAYYTQREQAERALAQAAENPSVRDIHLALAVKYAELVQRELVSFERRGVSGR
jgi:hypothetical protein